MPEDLFFTSALNFSSNLFSSADSCFAISKVMLLPSHQVFHTLLLVLIFLAPFRSSSIASSVGIANHS